MKVCELCGEEIDGTRDGENQCRSCEEEQANNTRKTRGYRLLNNGGDTLGSLGAYGPTSSSVVEESELQTMSGYERCGGGRRVIRKKIGGDN